MKRFIIALSVLATLSAHAVEVKRPNVLDGLVVKSKPVDMSVFLGATHRHAVTERDIEDSNARVVEAEAREAAADQAYIDALQDERISNLEIRGY